MTDRMVPLKRQGGYAKAYDFLLDNDSGLTDAELRVYLMLMRYGDTSKNRIPLQSTLAKRRGVSQPAIAQILKSLVEKGWLVVEHVVVPKEARSNAFSTKRNRYTLMVPAATQEDVSVIDDEDVVIEDEPPTPPVRVVKKVGDINGYKLKGGKLKGEPIEILLNDPDALRWYRDECRLDSAVVKDWLDNQLRPQNELDRAVITILSPHKGVDKQLALARCIRDLKSYAARNAFSSKDIGYVEQRIRDSLK